MKTFVPEISSLLIDKLSEINIIAYLHLVPESAPLPQVSFSNGIQDTGRTLNKKRTSTKLTWRISIVGSGMSQIQPVLDKLSELDGTDNDDFQDISLVMSRIEDRPSDAAVTRVFVDFNATEK